MGYLDSAGLARFAAWVKLRLSGKQDTLTPDGSIVLRDGGIGVALPTKAVTKAEYEALTEAEKQAEVLYAVTDDAPGGGSGASGNVYSTEEHRIGTWIDGKPLYQKTVDSPLTLSSNSAPLMYTLVLDGSAKNLHITDFGGCIYLKWPGNSSYTRYALGVFYPSIETTGKYWSMFTTVTSKGLLLHMDFRGYTSEQIPESASAIVTIEYTKTTDEGGSV